MPPRYAYWTILIDNAPTAFRSRDQAELLPTLNQLRRKSSNVVMKWFARGRLWDTPEQAQWAGKNLHGSTEKRGKEWRPGGQHKDPRARFDKQKDRPKKPFRPGEGKAALRSADDKTAFRSADDRKSFRPPDKKHDPWQRDRPWRDKPGGSQGQRKWQHSGHGPKGGRNPVARRPRAGDGPVSDATQGERGGPGHARPVADAKQGGRPWRDRPVARRPPAGKNPARDAAKGYAGETRGRRPDGYNPAPGRTPGRRDIPIHPADDPVVAQQPGGEQRQIDPKPEPADRGGPRTKDSGRPADRG